MKMKNKTLALGLLASVIAATSTMAFAGCGNYRIIDMNYTMEYAVVEENGNHVLHHLQSWKDSDSESVTFTCVDCGNYIWTSANNSVVYKEKPAEYAYDFECNHDHEME